MSPSTLELVPTDFSLTLSFYADFGKVSISVTAPGGSSVYQADAQAAYGTSIIIPTVLWAHGTYIIRITDSEGKLLKEILYSKET